MKLAAYLHTTPLTLNQAGKLRTKASVKKFSGGGNGKNKTRNSTNKPPSTLSVAS